jgi:hypothetical protein
MLLLDDQNIAKISLQMNEFASKKIKKLINFSEQFSIQLIACNLETQDEFNSTIPEGLVVHKFLESKLFLAFSYIGKHSFPLHGEEILEYLGKLLQKLFSTNQKIQVTKSKNNFPKSSFIWHFYLHIQGKGLPENCAIALGIIPKGKFFWIEKDEND